VEIKKSLPKFHFSLNLFCEAYKLFSRKKATLLAASASFYIILTLIPFFLLLIRIVGAIIGDQNEVNKLIFKLGSEVFPNLGPQLLEQFEKMIQGIFLDNQQFTFINLIILVISSLSFFNTIWSGIFLISDDHSFLRWWKHLKAIGVIALTVLVLTITLGFHPILLLGLKTLQYNVVIDILNQEVPALRSIIVFLREIDLEKLALFKENIFHFFIFLIYFTFIYRWFFNWKISLKQALTSSTTFVGLLLLGKNLFWIYFFYVRDTMISSYGDYYTFIVAIIWIYLVMCFFFFGVSLSVVFRDQNTRAFKSVFLSNRENQVDWDFPAEKDDDN
jgi:membrane protein